MEKKGDMVLNLLNIYKKPFDKKYLYRGDIAEELVKLYYTKKLNRPFKWYDEVEKKKNNYDFFPNFKQCGGIPDLEMLDADEIVEIKSKSMKQYTEIAENSRIPVEEFYQALYYGYLRWIQNKKNYKITMFYVFFDEETEKLIFENKKPLTYKNIKIFYKTFNLLDYKELMDSLLFKSLEYYSDCVRYKRIPLNDISADVLNQLDIIEGYQSHEL